MSESEFKTSLRHWLSRKLDRKEIRNLRWENEVEKVYFRIPWNKQEKDPNWEKEYELFKAWAEHRGTYEPGMSWTKLKSNFRSVLSKSNDFEEVRERRVEDQQTGNYRVYKRLTPKEATEKLKQNKKSRKTQSQTPCHATPESSGLGFYPPPRQEPNNDDTGCYGTPEQLPVVNRPPSQLSSAYNDSQSNYQLQYSEASFSQSQVSNFDQLFDESDDDIFQTATENFNPRAEEDSKFVDSLLSELESQPKTVVPNDKCDEAMSGDSLNTLVPNGNPPPVVHETDEVNNTTLPSIGSILQSIMSDPKIDGSKLWQCKAVVRYRRNEVGQQIVCLNEEHRLHYGPARDQKFGILAVRSHLPSEFKYQSLQLPEQQVSDDLVGGILEMFDQGIVLSMDSDGNIYATRLCQDRVYFYEQGDTNGRPKKLERKIKTRIFSYESFVVHCIQHKNNPTIPAPATTLRLHIGIEPKCGESFGLVSVTFVPLLADDILQYTDENNVTSLAYSCENSIDHLIRRTSLLELNGLDFEHN